jgi:hypothetical protein
MTSSDSPVTHNYSCNVDETYTNVTRVNIALSGLKIYSATSIAFDASA